VKSSFAAAARWERAGPSVIEKGYKIGISSDFWNRYEEDIALAKGLGAHVKPCCAYAFLKTVALTAPAVCCPRNAPSAKALRQHPQPHQSVLNLECLCCRSMPANRAWLRS